MTQTAVQWLEQQMKKFALDLDLLDCIDQAKVMETEQIIDAWNDGFDQKDESEADAFGYWNKTYGGKP
jgi:hypothetical protein